MADEEVQEPLLPQEQDQSSVSLKNSTPSIPKGYLYFGHFLERLRTGMWGYSVGLYAKNIWPNSLLSDDMFDVFESASTALFGPIVGHWVDTWPRTRTKVLLQPWLVSQNLSFLVAGGSVIALLVNSSLKLTNFTAFLSLVILTILSGAVGVLSTLARTILIKREWVVEISEGDSVKLLRMNSFIRLIDLICKLIAPVVTRNIISFVSLKASALTLALWNIISVWVEYWLFTYGSPALSESNERRASSSSQGDLEALPYLKAWRVYLKQDVVLSGIARALLFFSVPSFGTLMTTALEWQGIPAFVIRKAHQFSDVIGIAALLYPILQSGSSAIRQSGSSAIRQSGSSAIRQSGSTAILQSGSSAILQSGSSAILQSGSSAILQSGSTAILQSGSSAILQSGSSAILQSAQSAILQSHISTLRKGLWSIWWQWTFLLVCVASIWVQNHLLSAYMLMGGVALSRPGLRTFELSVIQQMQDHVSASDRCLVGGVQHSLQSSMDLMGYVMGVVISNPQDFWKLISISFGAVTMAAFLYTTGTLTNELKWTMENRMEILERKVTDFMKQHQ